MPKARYGSLPFDQQIAYFRNKLSLPSEAWDDIWGKAHNSAFVVAGAMENDLLNSFRKTVDIAISEGKGIGWFKSEFNQIVKKSGWEHTGDKDWRARIIYNTNLRQSYNAGRWEQLQQFDYWEYKHGDSFTPRVQHLAWDGLILHKDNPWWETHYPSNGWGCKCKVRGKRNAKVDEAPAIEQVDYIDKKTGEVLKVPKGIDPSFDYAPRATEQLKRQKQKLKESAVPYAAPERVVPSALSSVKTANINSLNAVMDSLADTEAKPQIEQLGQFLTKYKTKSLFIKSSELSGRTARNHSIKQSVLDYLEEGKASDASTQYIYPRNATRVKGYTSKTWNHVVTKVKAGINFSEVDVNDLRTAIKDAIFVKQIGDREYHSFSSIVAAHTQSENNGAAIITWLHELGHQVHYKAGIPISPFNSNEHWLTRYSATNNYEWFAEHFVAWALNREALNDWNADIAIYFDKLMEKVLNNE